MNMPAADNFYPDFIIWFVTADTHAGSWRRTKAEFDERHVLFMGDGNYVTKMMERLKTGGTT